MNRSDRMFWVSAIVPETEIYRDVLMARLLGQSCSQSPISPFLQIALSANVFQYLLVSIPLFL